MSRFTLFLEERQSERKVRAEFLRRMGFSDSAMGDDDLHSTKISSYKKQVNDAIKKMGMDEQKTRELGNWVASHPESSLQDVINQLSPYDIEQNPIPEIGKPGQLPKGDESLETSMEKKTPDTPGPMDGWQKPPV